jgi:hypothetical protein
VAPKYNPIDRRETAITYWNETVDYFYNCDSTSDESWLVYNRLTHMADQIRLLWKDITEGEDVSPVLLVEPICDVGTANLSLPSNQVSANVFDKDLSSPMSNVISDYSLSQIQVEDEQDVMDEEVEIPQRISIPPGHHFEESRSLIKKSVQF